MNRLRQLLLLSLLLSVFAACQPASDMQQATLTVSGMTCNGCSSGIAAELRKLEGIKSSVVSHESNTAVVHFNANAISVEEIAAAISELGFETDY